MRGPGPGLPMMGGSRPMMPTSPAPVTPRIQPSSPYVNGSPAGSAAPLGVGGLGSSMGAPRGQMNPGRATPPMRQSEQWQGGQFQSNRPSPMGAGAPKEEQVPGPANKNMIQDPRDSPQPPRAGEWRGVGPSASGSTSTPAPSPGGLDFGPASNMSTPLGGFGASPSGRSGKKTRGRGKSPGVRPREDQLSSSGRENKLSPRPATRRSASANRALLAEQTARSFREQARVTREREPVTRWALAPNRDGVVPNKQTRPAAISRSRRPRPVGDSKTTTPSLEPG